jgi:hypothetical protein
MYKYARIDSVLNLRGLSPRIKSEGVEIKTDSDANMVAVRSSEKVPDIARGPTLDDFGGRSDALGG